MKLNLKNKLQQLFIDNQAKSQAQNSGLSVVNNEEDNSATLYIYDAIGGWYGIEAEDFNRTVAGINAETIHVRVNSPGGDVFDARAMQTVLSQHPAKKIAHIDGLAASAVTYLCFACDEIEIAEGGFFMIHDAWTMALGNANDLDEVSAMLRQVDAGIVKDYQRKTGIENSEIETLMHNETWMTAETALEKGFVDRIYEPSSGAENSTSWDLSAYTNTPAALMKLNNKPKDAPDSEAIEAHRNKLLRRANMLIATSPV